MRLTPPKQARSEGSLARIVRAAREMLDEEGFAELSVARLARRAGSSVGAFYGRFADKQALLEQLAEVYSEEAQAAVKAFGEGAAAGDGLAGEVRAVVDFVVRFHRERAGLVRALLLEARLRPKGRVAERVRRMKALPPTLERRILAHRSAIGHPEPARAVAEGFFVVVSAVRERVVFGAEGYGEADPGFAEVLASAWLAILGAAGGGARGGGRAEARAPALYSS
jgi:AcrR family transcriptional regulator